MLRRFAYNGLLPLDRTLGVCDYQNRMARRAESFQSRAALYYSVFRSAGSACTSAAGHQTNKGVVRGHEAHRDVGGGPDWWRFRLLPSMPSLCLLLEMNSSSAKPGKSKAKRRTSSNSKPLPARWNAREVSGSSEITELKSVTHKEVITFGGCGGFGGSITISPADLELNANGSAKLEKRVTIKPEGAGCEVRIEPQTFTGIYIQQRGGRQGHRRTEHVGNPLQGHWRGVRQRGKHRRVLQRQDVERTRRRHASNGNR